MDVIRDSRWEALYKKYDNGNRDEEILIRLANYWWLHSKREERIKAAQKAREERRMKKSGQTEQWKAHFEKASKENQTEEMCSKLADSLCRAQECMDKCVEEKKKKSAKVITGTPKQEAAVSNHTKQVKKCQSTTLTGKPCPFKAVSECGRFCKKHSL